jgi:hypothetical protein
LRQWTRSEPEVEFQLQPIPDPVPQLGDEPDPFEVEPFAQFFAAEETSLLVRMLIEESGPGPQSIDELDRKQ